MNKTIYITKSESKIWDRAKKLSNGHISIIVMKVLKRYVSRMEKRSCKTCGQVKK